MNGDLHAAVEQRLRELETFEQTRLGQFKTNETKALLVIVRRLMETLAHPQIEPATAMPSIHNP